MCAREIEERESRLKPTVYTHLPVYITYTRMERKRRKKKRNKVKWEINGYGIKKKKKTEEE